MEIINKKISDLIPYEKNPRKNKEAVKYVANSIKEFGFKNPVLIDKNNVIIAGHTRYKASKKLKLKEVPCIYVDDLTDEQIKAFRLADNKVAEYAEWDFDFLGEELNNIIDLDMVDFGFDMSLQDKQTDENRIEVFEDVYPEIAEEPKSKYGDIYQLGDHRLMCGDSTKKEDVCKLMFNNIADMSFTSPPYNAGTTPTEIKSNKSSKYKRESDNKPVEEYKQFLIDFTINAIQNSKYTFINIQSIANNKIVLIEWMFKLKEFYADTMIWDKMISTPAMAYNVLNSDFEYIHIFSDKANRSIGTKKFRGTISNILHVQKQRNNAYSNIHNATFSMEFANFFVENFTNENESVLDLFGGTGTTLMVCEQLNRKCYTMELDPLYVDCIIERWEKFTGEKAVKING